ncbi:MAG: type I glyceraldehyde-3-phosphate dehydrogenase [Fuerstiella sp.]|nr:type I glyceraldehyde-3-phosphate dehydrogenase [Fuerstiella sp.]
MSRPSVKVGINGFGRIGRITLRALIARQKCDQRQADIEVVAINDLGATTALANLFKYDSAQGRFDGDVQVSGNDLIVNGSTIRICGERDPGNLPWNELGVDIALESTGFFTSRAAEGKPGFDSHISAGAGKVVISAPAKGEDLTVVCGVNDDQLTADHKCISNASCTTNSLAPMVKILHESFGGVQHGLITTCHAYTNDQKVADQLHSDPRRSRAAAVNIIPTSTGAAKAVGKVFPEVDGKLTGMSLRVPVVTGSVTDLTAIVGKDTTAEEINEAVKAAAEGGLGGILEYTEDPIVSSDIVGNSHSCIFDSGFTTVMAGNMVKVLGWYDNEYGYSCRTVELIERLAVL